MELWRCLLFQFSLSATWEHVNECGSTDHSLPPSPGSISISVADSLLALLRLAEERTVPRLVSKYVETPALTRAPPPPRWPTDVRALSLACCCCLSAMQCTRGRTLSHLPLSVHLPPHVLPVGGEWGDRVKENDNDAQGARLLAM